MPAISKKNDLLTKIQAVDATLLNKESRIKQQKILVLLQSDLSDEQALAAVWKITHTDKKARSIKLNKKNPLDAVFLENKIHSRTHVYQHWNQRLDHDVFSASMEPRSFQQLVKKIDADGYELKVCEAPKLAALPTSIGESSTAEKSVRTKLDLLMQNDSHFQPAVVRAAEKMQRQYRSTLGFFTRLFGRDAFDKQLSQWIKTEKKKAKKSILNRAFDQINKANQNIVSVDAFYSVEQTGKLTPYFIDSVEEGIEIKPFSDIKDTIFKTQKEKLISLLDAHNKPADADAVMVIKAFANNESNTSLAVLIQMVEQLLSGELGIADDVPYLTSSGSLGKTLHGWLKDARTVVEKTAYFSLKHEKLKLMLHRESVTPFIPVKEPSEKSTTLHRVEREISASLVGVPAEEAEEAKDVKETLHSSMTHYLKLPRIAASRLAKKIKALAAAPSLPKAHFVAMVHQLMEDQYNLPYQNGIKEIPGSSRLYDFLTAFFKKNPYVPNDGLCVKLADDVDGLTVTDSTSEGVTKTYQVVFKPTITFVPEGESRQEQKQIVRSSTHEILTSTHGQQPSTPSAVERTTAAVDEVLASSCTAVAASKAQSFEEEPPRPRAMTF